MTWKRTKIKELGVVYDGPHATPGDSEAGPVFLGIKNITEDGRLDLTEVKHISNQEYPKWIKRVKPQEDDVVFTYEATLHRYALIPSGLTCCLGRRTALVRPKQDIVLPRFLLHYFLSPQWKSYVDGRVIVGATVDRISIKEFPDFEIELPPLEVQKVISDILSAYDDLIENNLRRIQLLEEAARCQFKLMMEEESTCEMVPLSDLFDTASGGTPSRTRPDFYGGRIPWYKTKELQDSILLESEESITEQALANSSAKLFKPGTVLLAMYGATIGRLGILTKHATTNQACCAIMPRSDIFSTYFIFLYLKENKDYVLSFRMGAAQENISQLVVRNLQVPKIREEVLVVFNTKVEPIFALMEKLATQNKLLCQARDILLPRLMSGEIDVTSVKSPASLLELAEI